MRLRIFLCLFFVSNLAKTFSQDLDQSRFLEARNLVIYYAQKLSDFSKGDISAKIYLETLFETESNLVFNDITNSDQIEFSKYLISVQLLGIKIEFEEDPIERYYTAIYNKHHYFVFHIRKKVKSQFYKEFLVINPTTNQLINAYKSLPENFELTEIPKENLSFYNEPEELFLAEVTIGEEKFYIDQRGHTMFKIDEKIVTVGEKFYEGLLYSDMKGPYDTFQFGFLNKNGFAMVLYQNGFFNYHKGFRHGSVAVGTYHWGEVLINKYGERISSSYDDISDLNEYHYTVKKDYFNGSEGGVINTEGTEVIPLIPLKKNHYGFSDLSEGYIGHITRPNDSTILTDIYDTLGNLII